MNGIAIEELLKLKIRENFENKSGNDKIIKIKKEELIQLCIDVLKLIEDIKRR